MHKPAVAMPPSMAKRLDRLTAAIKINTECFRMTGFPCNASAFEATAAIICQNLLLSLSFAWFV